MANMAPAGYGGMRTVTKLPRRQLGDRETGWQNRVGIGNAGFKVGFLNTEFIVGIQNADFGVGITNADTTKVDILKADTKVGIENTDFGVGILNADTLLKDPPPGRNPFTLVRRNPFLTFLAAALLAAPPPARRAATLATASSPRRPSSPSLSHPPPTHISTLPPPLLLPSPHPPIRPPTRKKQDHKPQYEGGFAEMDQFSGPIDASLLYAQDSHRSQLVYTGQETEVLKCWEHHRSLGGWPVDPRIIEYVHRAGFFHLTQVQWIMLDWTLITALIERWRSETQTFHLRHGEMSITLQDVAILMRLPIYGDAVVGDTSLDWTDVCMSLLGDLPGMMRRGSVKLSWLRERFTVIADDALVEVVRQHARAYLLHLLGCTVFSDKT
ncbi:hypothetical protein Taro_036669 [Colocasia esculenta]|uniref:Aminotransferase-like plant mobile domain-containing protein n=1 Tax=Colocasia esculenta TaxID=4460 RepID=A0A843WAH1_COLES|nr:hypothetical protein [Colocasia esculenta]